MGLLARHSDHCAEGGAEVSPLYRSTQLVMANVTSRTSS